MLKIPKVILTTLTAVIVFFATINTAVAQSSANLDQIVPPCGSSEEDTVCATRQLVEILERRMAKMDKVAWHIEKREQPFTSTDKDVLAGLRPGGVDAAITVWGSVFQDKSVDEILEEPARALFVVETLTPLLETKARQIIADLLVADEYPEPWDEIRVGAANAYLDYLVRETNASLEAIPISRVR